MPLTWWDAIKSVAAPDWFVRRWPVRWRRLYRLDSAELTDWIGLNLLRNREAEKARREAERRAKSRRRGG